MNTNPERLEAYRESMRQHKAGWQKPFVSQPEPSLDPEPSTTHPLDNVPGLKRVSELQFGDIFRMHEGPNMDKYVEPHQGWRTFHSVEPTDIEWMSTIKSSRFGRPSDFKYSDMQNRRFQVMSKEEADQKDIAY
jgi:hypothetical protein